MDYGAGCLKENVCVVGSPRPVVVVLVVVANPKAGTDIIISFKLPHPSTLGRIRDKK